MAKVGLFYGSTTGNTVKAAELIGKAFGPGVVDLLDVGTVTAGELRKYDTLILGTSTWHWGGLQDEWALFEDSLTSEILRGKKVAFFGLGDQKRYPDNFVDGMGLLYEKVKPMGVQVIGMCSKKDYRFQASAAELGGNLVGLALDEDSEPGKTADRVDKWVRQLKTELGMK
ncbi:MAG TPA: flavodoxin [Sedimentisphaerales bacterium]|nr:flavodoxin [Sedimentisphaerales bacterium]